jgi:hypothetical protein
MEALLVLFGPYVAGLVIYYVGEKISERAADRVALIGGVGFFVCLIAFFIAMLRNPEGGDMRMVWWLCAMSLSIGLTGKKPGRPHQ